jgi:Pyruvate/2-oxoacid:ferredoxin oxidoreductase delta subunit
MEKNHEWRAWIWFTNGRRRLEMRSSARWPTIDPDRCSNCRACIAHCPKRAIEEALNFCCAKCVKYCLGMDVPCKPAGVTICEDLCDGCGKCLSTCPHEAIRWLEPATEDIAQCNCEVRDD